VQFVPQQVAKSDFEMVFQHDYSVFNDSTGLVMAALKA
jgi:hypothetical protein